MLVTKEKEKRETKRQETTFSCLAFVFFLPLFLLFLIFAFCNKQDEGKDENKQEEYKTLSFEKTERKDKKRKEQKSNAFW